MGFVKLSFSQDVDPQRTMYCPKVGREKDAEEIFVLDWKVAICFVVLKTSLRHLASNNYSAFVVVQQHLLRLTRQKQEPSREPSKD